MGKVDTLSSPLSYPTPSPKQYRLSRRLARFSGQGGPTCQSLNNRPSPGPANAAVFSAKKRLRGWKMGFDRRCAGIPRPPSWSESLQRAERDGFATARVRLISRYRGYLGSVLDAWLQSPPTAFIRPSSFLVDLLFCPLCRSDRHRPTDGPADGRTLGRRRGSAGLGSPPA